ncbi:hypothetical protein OVS_04390 [Mycoplasma ovis str. Michigan]|uniref:Uncharacterized protein n=1 Tax=Mycoplasma ovis str. Michigan TaxID=1415773 RepID=A0ABN4BMD3_9MOLU|nr:hypothetical protein [Mycoplasma ovis]AHC40605.1 hypothetical protein OVS_04390 [Mycoplasma ovis str. Michigan]
MKTKTKLFLGSLTLFVGAGGVVAFTLRNNFGNVEEMKQINPTRNSRSLRKSTTTTENQGLKLQELNTKGNEITIDTQLPEVQLDLQNNTAKELNISSLLGETHSQEEIKNVRKEIQTADRTGEMNKEVLEKYNSILRKHFPQDKDPIKKHIENMKDIRRQVTKEKIKEIRQTTDISHSLGQDKRESLQKIYALYQELTSEKNQFSLNLDSFLDGGTPITGISTSPAKQSQDFSEALKQIDWTKVQIKLTKDTTKAGSQLENDWGSWDSNPYSKFYDSEKEFEEDLKSLGELSKKTHEQRQKIYQELSSNNIQGQVKKVLDYQEWLLNHQLTHARSLVEYKIAKKILAAIKQ